MKVILLDDISKGEAGDVVFLSDGFVRNFLLPKKKAILATEENLKLVNKIKEERKKREEREHKLKIELKEKIEALTITMRKKTGEENRMFGQVTSQEIKDSLKEFNIDIDKKDILLPEQGIKSLGEHSVEIKLASDIKASLKVLVEAENYS
ncbi:MAG: 50S ribosomal protein L9 [bacterium]